ncbi:MAG TPA: hypothetical protein VKE94_23040, partial [Gemmataceae bacterium]|nr:hypothetical protein [Gemmataceae bacterium]
MKPTDIRIEGVAYGFEDFLYRTPLKFGGVAVDRVTLLDVELRVRTVGGKSATGFGSMPLGNVWAFPSKTLGYDDTLAAMKALAEQIRHVAANCDEIGHPIDIAHALEPAYRQAAEDVTRDLQLAEPIPWLAALVVASPFDAALHDAFGKVHGLNAYHTYGLEFLTYDLSHHLGPAFCGERLDDYIAREPLPSLPLYHLVGALDPITDADVRQRIADGLPETLPEWIRADGLT